MERYEDRLRRDAEVTEAVASVVAHARVAAIVHQRRVPHLSDAMDALLRAIRHLDNVTVHLRDRVVPADGVDDVD